MTTTQKTREELESLKANWLSDPCWDIEETEGFEAHREELKEFRILSEKRWEEKRQAEFRDWAKKHFGEDALHDYSAPLLRFLKSLEERVERLEKSGGGQ